MPDGPAPFTPEIASGETLQAQHTKSNDTVTDVNPEAIIARQQMMGLEVFAVGSRANQDRRDKAADGAQERRQLLADKILGT